MFLKIIQSDICVYFTEVYENGEDENPILNLGEF